ncbi:MAG: recombination mediator RecR [Bacteroidales bacterium]|jgi:recombination protein RecR|nr:recombination mediator RecR [Bacteroidales bacterium]
MSKLLDNAAENLAKLPGIGKRSAMRLALWLLKQDKYRTLQLAESLTMMSENIKYCKICHNISDDDICEICHSPKRDASMICVVADIRDVMAIENTSYYKGFYHVLGGLISPIEGIGANDLEIDSLLKRVNCVENFIPAQAENTLINEVILALPGTMDGNTTQLYLQKKLQTTNTKITTIARGIAVGDDLEYTDEMSLITSIKNRVEI